MAKPVRFYSPYDDVHPDMHPFLDAWAAVTEVPLHRLSANEVRAKLNSLGKDSRPPRPAGVEVEDIRSRLGDRILPMRIYRPAGAVGPQPVLLYFHGGGWTIGSLDSHDRFLCFYCEHSGVSIVAVDYRLSPEHKHPAQIEDAYDSLLWLAENVEQLGFDPMRLGIGGDSAGAQMATAACLLARERGGPQPRFQLLIYPVLDSNFDRYSWWRYRDGPILTRDWQIWCWQNWQHGDSPVPDPIAYPLQAEDLSGLPPAHVAVAEIDILHDEGVSYAERLLKAGVPVTLQVCRRLPHGFMRAMSASDYVAGQMRLIADAMRAGL
ncbi:alpha/beta hydrolase [Chelatococcus sp. GCM10030263]|uniref:alpha/beta hydrolase n=1 Tax=Chelatococcus sp. GCM10030263 TaxID=3273387 RepID=UPI0036156A3F